MILNILNSLSKNWYLGELWTHQNELDILQTLGRQLNVGPVDECLRSKSERYVQLGQNW